MILLNTIVNDVIQVDVIALILTTCITGVVGWLVKTVLDQLKDYRAESKEWRQGLGSKVDAISDATQTTMRTALLHYAEKYLTRGWLTPEERASIYDMHQKYSALHANGYIDSYMARVMELPDKDI